MRDFPSIDLLGSDRSLSTRDGGVFKRGRKCIQEYSSASIRSRLSNEFLNISTIFFKTRLGNSSYEKGHNLASLANFGERYHFSGVQQKLAIIFPVSYMRLSAPTKIVYLRKPHTFQQMKDGIQTSKY